MPKQLWVLGVSATLVCTLFVLQLDLDALPLATFAPLVTSKKGHLQTEEKEVNVKLVNVQDVALRLLNQIAAKRITTIKKFHGQMRVYSSGSTIYSSSPVYPPRYP